MVIPLNRYHTHEEIVRRKKRVRKTIADKSNNKSSVGEANTTATTADCGTGIDVASLNMHLKYEEIVADVTEMVEPSAIVLAKK